VVLSGITHWCSLPIVNTARQNNHLNLSYCFFCIIKIYSSKSNLKVHFRTHKRVKPYTCEYCEYVCMHHSSIKDHLDEPHTNIELG
jgi:hypothetical protein